MDMTTETNPQVWNLDPIFEGGADSEALARFLTDLSTDMDAYVAQPALPALSANTRDDWASRLQSSLNLFARLAEATSFVTALVSANTRDQAALQLLGRIDGYRARMDSAMTDLEAAMRDTDDDAWAALMALPELQLAAYQFTHRRTLAREKMDSAREALVAELAADGYYAWNRVYDQLAAKNSFEFDGKQNTLYQLQNKFTSHPQRETRKAAFELFEREWGKLSDTVAQALNYQAGFRWTMHKHRGWSDILHEPLHNNRLTRATLDTMWQVVEAKSTGLLPYLEAKARLLGLDKLTWYDLGAPVGDNNLSYSWAEAGDFVVDSIGSLDPAIADFCRLAIDSRWVESEDRDAKRAGAYCTSFPLTREIRVFMTFDGSYDSLSTLAHELGHGYHSHSMRDLPYGARMYTMSVAETASTMNELIVVDASLAASDDAQTRLSLLNEKLFAAQQFFMNIYSRYLFELDFFEARKDGPLTVEQLNALMVQAQQRAHHGALADDGYHGLFWASKLHFYYNRVPFYNFPYTFGYLFSSGVYAIAKQEGAGFSDRYRALLRDTGIMSTEELAQRHLGVDLTQPAFWEMAADNALSAVDEFVALASQPGS